MTVVGNKQPRVREQASKKSILLLLRRLPNSWWESFPRNAFTASGDADIMGCFDNGAFGAVEVKNDVTITRPNFGLLPSQIRFGLRHVQAGGFWCVAYHKTGVEEQLDLWFKDRDAQRAHALSILNQAHDLWVATRSPVWEKNHRHNNRAKVKQTLQRNIREAENLMNKAAVEKYKNRVKRRFHDPRRTKTPISFAILRHGLNREVEGDVDDTSTRKLD